MYTLLIIKQLQIQTFLFFFFSFSELGSTFLYSTGSCGDTAILSSHTGSPQTAPRMSTVWSQQHQCPGILRAQVSGSGLLCSTAPSTLQGPHSQQVALPPRPQQTLAIPCAHHSSSFSAPFLRKAVRMLRLFCSSSFLLSLILFSMSLLIRASSEAGKSSPWSKIFPMIFRY